MNALPRLKICGLTRTQDAKSAVSFGAWALGFVFYEKSPRMISAEKAGEIIRALGSVSVKKVGVFVDASAASIGETASVAGLDTVQLHGDESPEFCAALRELLPGVEVIKALRVGGRSGGAQAASDVELARVRLYFGRCEAVLLDTFVPGAPGGTGITGDWDLAARAAQLGRVILAGGLNPANIAAAVKIPGIFAFDVSSGLESAAGVKSEEQMKNFFDNSRGQSS